jgi:hypothetical protein
LKRCIFKPAENLKACIMDASAGSRCMSGAFSTLYDLIDPKKAFNPALSTVSAVIRALAA